MANIYVFQKQFKGHGQGLMLNMSSQGLLLERYIAKMEPLPLWLNSYGQC